MTDFSDGKPLDKAQRVLNKAEVIASIPLDYGMRWDASTEEGIGYLTDPGTNDVNSWADETGTLTLDTLSGTGTYPAYLRDSDGLPHVQFYATRAFYNSYDTVYDGATDMTVFCVTQSDSADQLSAANKYLVGGPGQFHVGHNGGTLNPPGALYKTTWKAPTNDFDSRRVIFSRRNVYNGAADNDVDTWCGKTNIHTVTADADANGVGYVNMGGYSTSATWQCEGKIYEYVVFLRALSDAEHEAWVNYLSLKWQVSNIDEATDATISPPYSKTIPQDYLERFDASTSKGMVFTTDEATGDLSNWTGERTKITLAAVGGTPTWTPGKVTMDGTHALRQITSAGTNNISKTIFLVHKRTSWNNGGESLTGPDNYITLGGGATAGSDEKAYFCAYASGAWQTQVKTTNDFDAREMVQCYRGTVDGFDYNIDFFVGDDLIGSYIAVDITSLTLNYTVLGGYTASGYAAGDYHELIIYDRALGTKEIGQVADYLSNKWQAQNEDSASSVIYAPVAADEVPLSWETRFPDKEGTALTEDKAITRHTVGAILGVEGAPKVGDWPQDYYERFDASTSAGMTIPSSTVTEWEGQKGVVTLLDITTGPTHVACPDGYQSLYFDGTTDCLRAVMSMTGARSYFLALRMPDVADVTGSHTMFDGPGMYHYLRTWTTTGAGEIDFSYANPSFGHHQLTSTQAWDETRLVVGLRHDGVDDLWARIGTTEEQLITTGTLPTDISELSLGATYGNAEKIKHYFYELIIYDRNLSASEADSVCAYLSRKWQAQNEDSASAVIARSLPDKYDDAYPAHFQPAGLTVTPGYWFRADVTNGMTFDSGDAKSGGVVSSWADIFGNVTMNTTASGDAAVDFHPNKRGFPCVSGGTAASPKSLESTASMTATNSQTKLYWSVVGYRTGAGDTNSSPCGLSGNLMFPDRDLNDNVSRISMTGTTTNKTYGIPGNANSGITINLWIVDTSPGSPYDTRRFTQGFEHPRETTTQPFNNQGCSVGALPTSNYDSDSYLYEMGHLGFGVAANAPTDDEIQTFIKHLCNRYNVDYMPDNTPWLISATSNTTANYVYFDMPYHYRADDLAADGETWELKEPTASVHSRVLNTTDGQNALDKTTNSLDRHGAKSNTYVAQHLRDATGYVWTETSVFVPAQTGVSTFLVGRNNRIISQGTMWEGASIMRQSTTTGKIQNRIQGDNLDSLNDETSNWVCAIATYDTTSYDHNLYVNNDAVQNSTGTAGSPSTTRPNIGANNALTGDNDCDVLEVAEFKHVLTAEERGNLQRYVRYRYRDVSDFGF